MFLTNVLLKKAKSKTVMVLMESAVSGHKFNAIRERLADKLELIRFDPYMMINTSLANTILDRQPWSKKALLCLRFEFGGQKRTEYRGDPTREPLQGKEKD